MQSATLRSVTINQLKPPLKYIMCISMVTSGMFIIMCFSQLSKATLIDCFHALTDFFFFSVELIRMFDASQL